MWEIGYKKHTVIVEKDNDGCRYIHRLLVNYQLNSETKIVADVLFEDDNKDINITQEKLYKRLFKNIETVLTNIENENSDCGSFYRKIIKVRQINHYPWLCYEKIIPEPDFTLE